MSHAAKYRKRAVEFEQLKQFDKAISCYIRAIDDSAKRGEEVDVALLNKVGDLSLRLGNIADAVTYYERAVERYATIGLFNNAIALCNKILRNAPGRSTVYFTLGRICAKKGLRGDASRNFLEYAARMRSEDRTDEAMRALAEVAELMPELTEVRGMVEEHAARAGIVLTRRKTPATQTVSYRPTGGHDLVFLDVGFELPEEQRPPVRLTRPASLDNIMIFDPVESDGTSSEPGNGDSTQSEIAQDVVSNVPVESSVDYIGTIEEPAPLQGLVITGEYNDPGILPVEGLTALDPESEVENVVATPLEALTSRIETVATEATTGIVTTAEFFAPSLPDVQPLADSLGTEVESVSADSRMIDATPLEVESVVEIDNAIAEGAAVALAGETEVLQPVSSPFRLDPHNFILPGELPPLMVPDALLRVGESTLHAVESAIAVEQVAAVEQDIVEEIVVHDAPVVTEEEANKEATVATSESPTPVVALQVTEAAAAAQLREATLAAAVEEAPQDWALRHRYAEALIEVGRREDGIRELEASLAGFAAASNLNAASEVADELIQVGGHRIAHHQKRVELAVRLAEPVRLRTAYLDLADALVRMGEEARAHVVYARVLELDPRDERARTALGAAAPPLPEPKSDDEYVDFASWMHEEEGESTRMRMREPAITGDEQADFDALLRHFKEGVARSIGDDDHDSHYDLGVAYKEMGLLDDAIAEFQKALRSRVHRLPAYEALGQCFVEQERHQVATTVLSRAMHEPGLDDHQRIGVLYLLGYSLAALQRIDDARGYFQRVHAIDRNFRDVAARLAAIDQVAR